MYPEKPRCLGFIDVLPFASLAEARGIDGCHGLGPVGRRFFWVNRPSGELAANSHENRPNFAPKRK